METPKIPLWNPISENMVIGNVPSDSAVSLMTRALLVHFLNTGAFDDEIRALKFTKANRINQFVFDFIHPRMDEFQQKFFAWGRSNDFASFIGSCPFVQKDVKEALRLKETTVMKKGGQVNVPSYCEPLTGILRERMKLLVDGMNVKVIPKDIQKSFHTKVVNRIKKLAEIYSKNRQAFSYLDMQQHYHIEPSLEEVVRIALEGIFEPYVNWGRNELREIAKLARDYGKVENLDETTQKLIKEAQIAEVMAS